MTTTPRSGLPLLAAAQAQKHVTHNEALLQLDALLFARFLDRDLSAPPSSPADGDTYLVKATASGDWTGQDGNVAYASDGGWRFALPFAGLMAFVADESIFVVYHRIVVGGSHQPPHLREPGDAGREHQRRRHQQARRQIGGTSVRQYRRHGAGQDQQACERRHRLAALSDELFRSRGVRALRRRRFPRQGLARRIELDRRSGDRRDERCAHAGGRRAASQRLGRVAVAGAEHELRSLLRLRQHRDRIVGRGRGGGLCQERPVASQPFGSGGQQPAQHPGGEHGQQPGRDLQRHFRHVIRLHDAPRPRHRSLHPPWLRGGDTIGNLNWQPYTPARRAQASPTARASRPW